MQESSKWDYVRVMSERYQSACRKEKRKEKRLILDELEKNLGIHRKSLIGVMSFMKIEAVNHTSGFQPCEAAAR